jgi:hypothetical protein
MERHLYRGRVKGGGVFNLLPHSRGDDMLGKGTYRTKEEKARIVMEVLSSSSTISEICRKYNVASSAVYKLRDAFIAEGTAAMENGRSTV